MASYSKQPDWLEIAKTARINLEERRIKKDSDGNVCRVSYPAGIEAKAARAAEEAARFGGIESGITAIQNAFEGHEISVVDKVYTS